MTDMFLYITNLGENAGKNFGAGCIVGPVRDKALAGEVKS